MNQLSTPWDRQAFPALPAVSFEFFPPATPELHQKLWQALERLAPLAPRFASVTYGAGGSTRERTHETVVAIQERLGLRPAAHLTCVGATQSEIESVAKRYWQAGIRHIVALRGDPPEGKGKFVPHPQGYRCAAELVAGLKKVADFEISVAAHPETHPDALSPAADLENLKRKQDAGAARGITQFFFDVELYLRFRDKAVKAGVSMPLVPGILPVTNFRQVQKFASRCGASVPASLARHFEGLDDDPETRKLVAAHVAGEQCRRLQAEGVHEFHFYTLNRAELTRAICHLLGIRARDTQSLAEDSVDRAAVRG
ncbi:MAG: methylenetetrahydrofolate reductase [NAD(P)H] [Gammaproteobacteria bacterium]|nr:methylenetetrahydrofolate reductase [NAD(P)H] [Gammaproteobacteria bacterium]